MIKKITDVKTLVVVNSSMKNNLFIIYMFIINIGIASVYNVGDNISIEHQNILFDICYGHDGQNNLKLADYNGEINGGDYKVIWIDMAATW